MRSIYYNDKLRGLGMGGTGRLQRIGTLYMCEREYAVQMGLGRGAVRATSDIRGEY